MKRVPWLFSVALVAIFALVAGAIQRDEPSPESLLDKANQLRGEQNWNDALKIYRRIVSRTDADGKTVADAIERASGCVLRLNQFSEIDGLLAQAIESHPRDWRVLRAAAVILRRQPHNGIIADQRFTRGYTYGRQSGVYVQTLEQDRLQAMKWLLAAIERAEQQDLEDADQDMANLHLELASAIQLGRHGQQAWQLQVTTDVTAKPDYLDFDSNTYAPSRYAPVDEADHPLLYTSVDSFEAATSDGQRFRWALQQAERSDHWREDARLQWAHFLHTQFSVDTLAQDAWLLRRRPEDEQAQSGRFAIHTLSETETIARLASGVKRFQLDDETNPIWLYRQIASSQDAAAASSASWSLVQTFLNRRQYPKAATELAAYIERFGDDSRKSKKKLLDSIRQPRISFDPVPPQVAGKAAQLSLLFRNATEIEFVAYRVDVEKMLIDTKNFYRNFRSQNHQFGATSNRNPPNLDSPVILFSDQIAQDYVEEKAGQWTQVVKPRPNHWDRRSTIDTPLTQPGLYLIEANANDGAHRARCLAWIHDTVIVRKPISGKQLFYIADAESGEPVAGANLELFGMRYQRQQNGRNQVVTKNFALRSDASGQVEARIENNFQWYAVARSAGGRRALLGFDRLWSQQYQAETYRQWKAFGVAERPVYRPGDTLRAKFWLAYTAYGDVQAPRVANADVTVQLLDPQGNQVTETKLTTDDFGGCDLETDLPKSAALGRYHFNVRGPGGWVQSSLAVRVEEYRKPEFEVNILAPSKPVALGETVEARIQAKYYFGTPVTDAEVAVTVQRSTYQDAYYPAAPFDWCYGPGYWWFAEDYLWYPGYRNWCGCFAPSPWWFPRWGYEPPELVLQQQLELDSQGEAVVSIDTALAKAIYGDQDHRYSISVEVRDASRRTITAQGNVIAAREAFKIYSWTDRGYYRVGDRIEANFHSRMLDGTTVTAQGNLDLLRITYDALGQPTERTVATFPVATDEDGRVKQVMQADQPGQYRLRLRLSDDAEHTVEGGYIFTVRGAGATGADFRYGNLELVPDKQHYAPGDTVRLQLASDREDARVALFIRPVGGVYQLPRFVKLESKSAIVEIPVTREDQPNFFVEAFTVYDGGVHHKTREIIVPPENKVLEVSLSADQEEYLPGQEAVVDVRVRDSHGEPVAGSCLISAYDRSLEQIAPDVLPDDIREFFWKWRRNHRPQYRTNVQRPTRPLHIRQLPRLLPLGIFGASLADDMEVTQSDRSRAEKRQLGTRQSRGRAGGFGVAGGLAEPSAAPMSASANMAVAEGEAAPMDLQTDGMAAEQGVAASPKVRKDFADSALWLASITTDDEGKATAQFKMPENLTSWKLRSWAVGSSTRVGSSSTEVVTRKQLLVRLQQPRFLVERDEVVLSAIVHNDLPTEQHVRVSLEIDGQTQLERMPGVEAAQAVDIQPHEQARVDWRCRAVAEGNVTIRALAISDAASDAMQLELPIVVNGILKTESLAGTVRRDEDSAVATLTVPDQRRTEQSRLTVRLSPSLAAAMIDALPYMADYPYGCTEQTLNRFLPTVMTQRVLQDMKVDLASLKAKRNNLNAQELGEPAERRQRWKRLDRNPVYDVAAVADMVDSGVRRLSDMQNGDGGWGWFSGRGERSYPHTTATVVRGLLIAQQNEVAIVPDVLQRGVAWLEQHQNAELQQLNNAESKTRPYKEKPDNTDALVFHVLTLADRVNPQMQRLLVERRQNLSVYGKALVAWAMHRIGDREATATLRRNIEQFLVEDTENETAYLSDDTSWWYWYGSQLEATAIYLKLLAAQEPHGRTAPRLVKYLLNNRKHGTYWNSTRDTALIVEAFADYIQATGETSSAVTAEVWLSGKRLGRIEFTPENLFEVDNTIEIGGSALPAGEHQLEIRRVGDGNLYWNAYSTNFTLEEEIAPAGLEVKIERRYYRLDVAAKDQLLPGDRAAAVPTKKRGLERSPIDDLQDLPSGSLVEVELLVESKNDYEYLLIEDHKPASLEAVDTQSGYFYNSGLSIYRELRDQHVGLCIRWLPRGSYSIRYQLRSEAPGTFTALPATIQGMYAPELVGNSADFDLSVVE